MKQVVTFIMSVVTLLSCADTQEVGKPYCGWKEGEMDIHHIYTGRGESSLLILPDATSLLVDIGDWDPDYYDKMSKALPNSSRRAGEWVARYVERVNPRGKVIDYLMISHFHEDHMGDCSNPVEKTKDRDPNYLITGVTHAGEYLSFNKIIDRAWPDYTYPLPIIEVEEDVNNYRAFLDWKLKQKETKVERFVVGKSDQVRLLYDNKKYGKIFKVQNLVANGDVWTGKGENYISCYDLHPDNKTGVQNENTKSIGICVSYGPFRYFTAGDLSGKLKDADGKEFEIDEVATRICGQVDVCKANHHAYLDAMTEGFLKQIDAQAYIIQVWDYLHLQPSIIERMVSTHTNDKKKSLVFPTYIPSPSLLDAHAGEPWMSSVCKETGHVVVKVFDNGKQYKIYVLSADDETQIVKATYGPYAAGDNNKR
ncbi:MAG: hypothetical protein RR382_03050 [Tannerellaceae bacterium]